MVSLATIPGPYSSSSFESWESNSSSSSNEDEEEDRGDPDAPDPPDEPLWFPVLLLPLLQVDLMSNMIMEVDLRLRLNLDSFMMLLPSLLLLLRKRG